MTQFSVKRGGQPIKKYKKFTPKVEPLITSMKRWNHFFDGQNTNPK